MIDLQQFCSTEIVRVNLQKPFSRGDHTYASNGYVAVRVPRMAEYAEQDTPKIEEVFAANYKDDAKGVLAVVLPDFEGQRVKCGDCHGTGKEHDCPNCDCECENCDGDGDFEKDPKIYVKVGEVIFAAKYIRQLIALPGLKFSTVPVKDNPASFTFESGDGIVMPISYVSEGDTVIPATVTA